MLATPTLAKRTRERSPLKYLMFFSFPRSAAAIAGFAGTS
jgi:hypothetical protein